MRVYKNNNKLYINVPFEVIKGLGIKENDEVDFFRFNSTAFLFSKKSDVASLLAGSTAQAEKGIQKRETESGITENELGVLQKLDTMRYPQRTVEEVGKRLSAREKEILLGLLKKNAVAIFPGKEDRAGHYSISKDIYDRFLMRKGKKTQPQQKTSWVRAEPRAAAQRLQPAPSDEGLPNELKTKGYVVVSSEAEAAALSLAVEESIRHGQILGIRSFNNKKFYIATRWFLNANSGKILKSIGEGSRVDDVAEKTGVSEEGVRSILYLLSENGDVREKKKDFFVLA